MAKQPVTPSLVTEALNQLPERIHVGAHPVRIKVFEPGDKTAHGVWGQYDMDTQTIWLSREFPSLTFMGMIFTHELLHAIWHAQGLNEDGEHEERVVTLVATGLTQVYRDNPWLLEWIALTYRFDRVPPRFAPATGTATGRFNGKKPNVEEKPKEKPVPLKKPRATRKQRMGFIQ